MFESVRACACLCLRVRRWPVPGALYLVACAWWRSEGRRVCPALCTREQVFVTEVLPRRVAASCRVLLRPALQAAPDRAVPPPLPFHDDVPPQPLSGKPVWPPLSRLAEEAVSRKERACGQTWTEELPPRRRGGLEPEERWGLPGRGRLLL